MKKVNLKYIGLGIVFVLLVVGIPVIMDKCIIGNNVPSNIDNSDWVSFLGSYIGAVLGGVFTFIGIKITLYNSVEKKKQRDMLALQLKGTRGQVLCPSSSKEREMRSQDFVFLFIFLFYYLQTFILRLRLIY